jgi:BlaI family transcriptional regulator, penicillinase repressor
MTRKRPAPRLSAGEMEIMDILWQRGPVSLAEAHQAMPRAIGYTTVQTRLNRLADKGLVARSTDRPARYEARVAPEQVGAGHLDTLLERVTSGRVVPLVAHLVSESALTREEIDELKRLIAEAERNCQPRSKEDRT